MGAVLIKYTIKHKYNTQTFNKNKSKSILKIS